MAENQKTIDLLGRVIISGTIRALTGLHVGKGKEGLMIGGVDNPVMRDMLTNVPYIPGSSLKGKLRSLAEKREPTAIQNKDIGKGVFIHICKDKTNYDQCPVCRIYGVPGQSDASSPTRLVVRDVFLTEESKKKLELADTDQLYTEVKYEASIDRVTSAANPRSLERVPAQSIFGPFEMVYSIYEAGDIALLDKLVEAMALLEDDYLGGSGSRGSGKIKFEKFTVVVKPISIYMKPGEKPQETTADDLAALAKLNLPEFVRQHIPAGA